jgi:hypothetical protein
MSKTVGEVLQEVRELKERATIHQALASYLRTYYMGRDSGKAQKQLNCDAAPVSERVIEEIACELEEASKEALTIANSTLSEKYDG